MRSSADELLDARVGRVAGDLLDPEVPVGAARDLRQVRDRDHLRARGQARERVGDAVRGRAADARVDLVEDHRLAAADGGDRQRDAGELAARGRLGDRRERQPGVRPDQERDLVGAGRALARARRAPRGTRRRPCRSRAARAATASANGPAAAARASRSAAATAATRASACATRPSAASRRVEALVERLQLRPRLRRAGEQLLGRLAAEAPPRVGDPVELALDLLEPARVGLEHRQERAQGARRLAQAQLGVAELVGGLLQLRREPLDRRERALGGRGQAGGALALLGIERLRRRGRALDQLGQVPQPLALLAQRLLLARLHPLGVLDERAQLGEPRLRGGRVARELVVPPPRSAELAPGEPRLGPPAELLVAAERVEDGELVRGPREPALLELARHREQPLAERGDVLAGGAPAPRVRARPALRADPPRQHDALLVVRPQLGERLERLLLQQALREVELGLDVRLGRARPDVAPRRPSRRAAARSPARGSSCPRPSRP